MFSSYVSKFLVLAPACLMLSACGPGWDAVKVTDIVPYGNSRTAGSGVMYVRANLMPEKNVNLDAQSSGVQEMEVILDGVSNGRGDSIFKDHQAGKK